jgi:hypothetical protein
MVNLASIYVLADLADDFVEKRQTCIDVLCEYLRLAAPRPREDAPPDEHRRWQRDQAVRRSVIDVIATHLREDAAPSWAANDFDFTGAVFYEADFSGIRLAGGKLTFSKVSFPEGEVIFRDADFSGGGVDFSGAKFCGALVSFHGADFSGADVCFSGASISGGEIKFDGARFTAGDVRSPAAVVSGGRITFDGARSLGGAVDLFETFPPR